ncbi:MAG: DNA replication complex GINS family protein [Candidatus Aenigmarchaeota archaeon]|nr:DNA replication complex GINS family protein [Candidatus Aenigmarchaeota archaeon]
MLTFEKIRDLERAERESKGLQKLPDNLMEEIRSYIHKKEKLADSSAIIEMENVKNIIKRFFELRETKLVSLALYSVKTNLPVENLTKEEETLFSALAEKIKNFRQSFFSELQNPVPEQAKEVKNEVYRVKKSTPEFVGPDLKLYRFNENELIDVSVLPKPLNDLLLKEGVIEKVVE